MRKAGFWNSTIGKGEMAYQKYGESFKKLRLQHQLPLSGFEHLGIAKSTLSHFESGKNMLRFDKLDMALQEMHTSLQDYALIVNNFQPDYFIAQFLKIENAYLTQDRATLKELYQHSVDFPSKETYFIGLSAKSFYSRLTSQERENVENFLKGVKVWGVYELSVFVSTLFHLSREFVEKVMEKFWKMIHHFLFILEYRVLVMRAVVRANFRFIDEGNGNFSQQLIEHCKKILFPEDVTNRIMLRFVEGYWLHKFSDEGLGKKQMKQVLHILKVIEANDLRKIFLKHYTRRLNASENE